MTSFYLDTSALVKLYVEEAGSRWMHAIFRASNPQGMPTHQLAFAKIGIVEIAAAIVRRERAGDFTADIRSILYKKFLYDSEHRFRLLGLTDDLLYLAAELAQRLGLRGYDAVHLASALNLRKQLVAFRLPELVFVSADEQLCQAAASQGLSTDNPNHHG